MRKSKNKPVLIVTIATCLSIGLYLLLDYLNIPSRFGVHISEINMDALGIFTSFITAVIIFLLTYFLIERWNLRKQYNQTQIASMFLTKTYKDCKFYLSSLDLGALDKLVKRTDFNAYYNHDSPADRYADIPFENEQKIMQYAEEGIISSEIIEKYLEVKNEYMKHIMMSVTFFDHPEIVRPTRKDLLKLIDDSEKSIRSIKRDND